MPRFEARLPGIRPRAFVHRADGVSGEVPLNLDTLVADLDAGRLVLVWRGLFEVHDDQLDDVRTLLIESETLGAPVPAEHHLAELATFDADPVAFLKARLVPEDLKKQLADAEALADALPYEACEGDVLLVIGEAGECFVIGVVAGRGKTSLEIQGSVALRAVGGQLDLSGDEGVRVRGPVIEVRADKLETVADSVVETVASLFQRVTKILHVHARQHLAIVDEGSYSQAKTTTIQTEDTVAINGKEIHLG